jgi:hypothetical protein
MMDSKYLSVIDTDRFGFKIAKINHFESEPKVILNELRDSGIKLIISRIEFNNIDLLNKLEDIGFRIKDSQVTYIFEMKNFDSNSVTNLNDTFTIREFQINDLDKIVEIAEESFNNYGHYFANKKLDRVKCLEIYKDWAYRSCTDSNVADKIFVAENENGLAGFLSFKKEQKEDKVFAVGGMGAVSGKHRGLDVFKKIAIKGLQWGVENNFDWEEHNVLVNNYSVNRSFSKLGFKTGKFYITLHCWLN